MAPTVLRLFMALLATVFGLYFVGALVSGQASLPQRFGPSLVVDRRGKPSSFWTAVVVAGIVTTLPRWSRSLGKPVRLEPCDGQPNQAWRARQPY
jgi:hypothetical protein